MGHVTHHAIVVTSFDERDINEARDTAIGLLGLSVSPIVESPVNGYYTFLVGPDGSKSGWKDSDHGDALRAQFKSWLRGCRYEDGSSPFSWVEVEYSSDDQSAQVVSHEWQDKRDEQEDR